jgi:signal transduction histidine kinase
MKKESGREGRRGWSIRYWLLIANAFVVLVPLFAVLFVRLWDRHLVRVTEERLIAEAALLVDAWRAELADETSLPSSVPRVPVPTAGVKPRLERSYTVQPEAPTPSRFAGAVETPARRAALRIAPLVSGVERRRSSQVELLDASGCVLAATDEKPGACLDPLPEVAAALRGEYMAVARAPQVLEAFSLDALRSYRSVLVFAAVPVRFEGELAGVVRMSTRSSGPFEALIDHRATVLLAAIVCGLLMAAVTHFFSRAISRPVRAVTAAAEAVARGEPPSVIPVTEGAPAELRSLGDAVLRMTEQLTDRAQYIAGFAATVSHELKTPVAAIRGAVELLRDEWGGMSEEQRRRFLDNVDADAERMQRLVTRLLELARIQSAPEAAAPVEVRPFFLRLCERYGDRVQLSFAEPPHAITINADHLEAAVRNLIDNGMRHGNGKPVEVAVGSRHGRVSVSVRDHGNGISEGNRARIFDRFFTTERDRGGTGLGLAIVQAVAETRGGGVRFESGPDGSTFVLTV